ncbi:hypothetical protein [Methylocucumis oryzae]|uniref:Uncharacterized protein n=1 Tax=Methylocucumis oryzae TaxID=1632867 RepID=A0A0F3IMS9_9GAMM|nr:hypothetical protein [Methylocucumis oryzae]KJV08016.1 hypothetical protein VZ94_00960 [Methylocucumis oryzae]
MKLITIAQFQKKHKLSRYWFFHFKGEKPIPDKMEKRCVRNVALYDEAALEKLLPNKSDDEELVTITKICSTKRHIGTITVFVSKKPRD